MSDKKSLKHIALFLPGVFLANITDFESEPFPTLSDLLLNTDMNKVKQGIENKYTAGGWKNFIASAKANFGIEADQKLTPQVWKAAVESYRTAQTGGALVIDMNDGNGVPENADYNAAAALRGTAFSFAATLSPEYFKEATEAGDDVVSMDKFLALMPAAPAEVAKAVEKAAEPAAKAPEQQLPDNSTATAEGEGDAAEDDATDDAAEENTETGIVAGGPLGVKVLGALVKSFDDMDEILAANRKNMDEAFSLLKSTADESEASTREGFKGVRTALLSAFQPAEIEAGE